jgi:aspartyl/asparaginyl beta-hydroxylase (cupin superfamily)/Tfp pilus assembly protein PilF
MNTLANPALESMIQNAREMAKAGRAADAEALWRRVLEASPGHAEAVLVLGMAAITRGEPARAIEFLKTSVARNPMLELYMALANKQLGNTDEEMAAVTRALDLDPYFFPALLHKGMLLERLGKRRNAAQVFRDVLKIMPPRERLNEAFRTAVRHAEASVAENQQSLEQHLDAALAELRQKHGRSVDRFERSVDVMLGRKKMYQPEPIALHYADLPPLQFHDRDSFPWLPELEAHSDDIRAELIQVLAESRPDFRPYIQYPPGAPVNQWAELNYSPRWSTYFLWESGRRNDEHCERCPKTTAVLENVVPMARLPNFSPTAMFSCLEPRTVIPPHTGETNTRLIVHLPLIIPANCSFRVGHQSREWKYGEAFVFDDSIEHEARNGSDELRAVLIFDVWNPLLSPAERELVAGLMNGVRDYYRAEP